MIYVCTRDLNRTYPFTEPYSMLSPEISPISEKNSYRHLRQMFYIWKNSTEPEITIFQENRHLKDIHAPSGYDVVLPARTHKSNHCTFSLFQQWRSCATVPSHNMEYFLALLETVPEMVPYASIENNPYARYHNMGTFPLPVYQDMCSFLFSTLSKLEEVIKVDPKSDNCCYAFLGERIADFWFYKHQELKVYDSDIVEI